MESKWIIEKEGDLEQIAKELLTNFKNNRVFTFSGNLGSGKTTFIKYLCKVLGVTGQVSSPTFALVNEYDGDNSLKIYHFDFYRIKNEREAYDMGYEEYFYSGGYCFIEWPEMISELVPPNAVTIQIDVNGNTREIRVKE